MISMTEDQKHECLRELLFQLAKDHNALETEEERATFYGQLEDIYYHPDDNKRFRHLYSQIFSWITFIDEDPALDTEVLAQNLSYLRFQYKPTRKAQVVNKDGLYEEKPIDIEPELNKLFDHVNLDVARLNYIRAISSQMLSKEEVHEVSSLASETKKKLDALAEKTADVEDALESAQKTVKSAQRDSITILGIFAAIVLAFTGGLAYSTSVFENMADVSIYRLLGVAVIISFTLLNSIYLLLKFLAEITNAKSPSFHIGWVNALLVITGGAIFITWVCG